MIGGAIRFLSFLSPLFFLFFFPRVKGEPMGAKGVGSSLSPVFHSLSLSLFSRAFGPERVICRPDLENRRECP